MTLVKVFSMPRGKGLHIVHDTISKPEKYGGGKARPLTPTIPQPLALTR